MPKQRSQLFQKLFQDKYRYYIVAHRGASEDAPENTHAAFELAWKQGADAVELDVRMTKDGKLVVIHDDTTKRVQRGWLKGRGKGVLPEKDFKIENSTWEELKNVDVGNEKYTHQSIPLLEDVAQALPDGKKMFIELKTEDKRLLPELARILEGSEKLRDQFVIISFSDDILKKCKEFPKLRKYKTLWCVGKQFKELGLKLIVGLSAKKLHAPRWEKLLKIPLWTRRIIRLATKARVDGLDIDMGKRYGSEEEDVILNYRLIKAARKADLEISAWTINLNEKLPLAKNRRAKHAWMLRVTYITTNQPGKMRKALETWEREGVFRVSEQSPVPSAERGIPKMR